MNEIQELKKAETMQISALLTSDRKKCERVRGQKADVAKKMQIKSTICLEDTAVSREI